MFVFLTGFTPPESIFVDYKYILPVFATIFEKQELFIRKTINGIPVLQRKQEFVAKTGIMNSCIT